MDRWMDVRIELIQAKVRADEWMDGQDMMDRSSNNHTVSFTWIDYRQMMDDDTVDDHETTKIGPMSGNDRE